MAETPLFRRKARITINTIEITDLAMQFKVKKTLKPEPNTAEVRVFNLNPDHRSALEHIKTASVMIEAGYEQGLSVLFLGDLRTAISVDDGPDIVTSLSSGDGEKAVQTAQVSVSFKKGTANPQKVLETVAKALGVGEGNLKQALTQLSALDNHFSEGTVISGSAYREMNAITRSLGLTWSIQDGKLQILPLRQALDGEAIVVSPETGMVGSPTVDSDGVLKVSMLMAPDVFPGRKLVLKSKRLQGQYRIEACEYTGDTHGQDWYISIEAKRY